MHARTVILRKNPNGTARAARAAQKQIPKTRNCKIKDSEGDPKIGRIYTRKLTIISGRLLVQ